MRRINVTDYMYPVKTPEGETKELRYDVRESMVDVLFHPEQQLTAREALERDELAQKILATSGEVNHFNPLGVKSNSVFLEEAEYAMLRAACETARGFGKQDVELILRILNAPKVEPMPEMFQERREVIEKGKGVFNV